MATESTPGKGSASKRKSTNTTSKSFNRALAGNRPVGKRVSDANLLLLRSLETVRDDGDDKKTADENDQEHCEASAANESQLSLEEADNIVQDALQLAENDELNEYRDVCIHCPVVNHVAHILFPTD